MGKSKASEGLRAVGIAAVRVGLYQCWMERVNFTGVACHQEENTLRIKFSPVYKFTLK